MAEDFAHLHVHTEYSALDGAALIKPLARRAAELGMSALGMTDHGNLFGAFEFHRECAAAGVKPIVGIEAYLAPESRLAKRPIFWGAGGQRHKDADGESGDVSGRGAYLHMTLLAEDADGLRNLMWLSSMASIEGQYPKGKPRMDRELIAERCSGIIASTGCVGGEISTRLRLGQFDEALQAAGDWQDILGKDNYFLELMDHGLAVERNVRDGLLEIGRKVGLKPIATNDSHYVLPEHADAHDTLLCVGVGKNKADANRFRFDGDGYYLKSPAEMREIWDAQVPGACDNTLLIAERVQSYDQVFKPRDLMPRFDVPDGHTQETWLREEVERGLRRRFGEDFSAEIRERIEYELGVIERTGFAAYFLVVADIIAWARDNGIAVGPGRGSTAGSLVAYVTGITDVDPIKFGLMFERFLNPERVSPPDADLDFEDRRRGELIDYVTRKYGSEHCANVITFGTLKAKAAVKDAARVLGFPYFKGDMLSKALPGPANGNEASLAVVFDETDPRYHEGHGLRELMAADPESAQILQAARGIEGIKRQTGVHAAGIILAAERLIDVVPLQVRDPDDDAKRATIVGFEYPQAESMGLLKIDFLGLRNLTMLFDALASIKARLGIEIDLNNLPLDDAKTFELLARGDTLGVFQLDGTGIRNLLRLMRPTQFKDISAALALYRPGPMGADAHTNYALRKTGRQPLIPVHPELSKPLEEILGETYQLIVYQEQVMALAQRLAGYTLAGADILRKAMGKKKKEILDKEWNRFSAGMRERGYSAEATQALWDVLIPFSDYAFNLAHATAYGMIAYQTAYLKAHYPADYMAATLTSVGNDKDKMGVYLGECRHMGVTVLPPDVNVSGMAFTATGDKEIRFGLKAVRNVGANAVEAIAAGRAERPYANFGDFLGRIGSAACTKRAVEALIKAGAFDSLGHPRQGLWKVHIPAVERASANSKKAALGMESLFGDDETTEVIVPDIEWDQKILLDYEREMLGLYVSDHPLSAAEETLRRERTLGLAEILTGAMDEESSHSFDGMKVTICGMAARVEHKVSKAGNDWALLTLEDLEASLEVPLFGETHHLYARDLIEGAVYAIDGEVQVKDGAPPSVIARSIRPIEIVLPGQPVEIRLHTSQLTPRKVGELREILIEHRGDIPVRVHVDVGDSTKVCALPDYPVKPSPGLAAELKGLFGPDVLRK